MAERIAMITRTLLQPDDTAHRRVVRTPRGSTQGMEHSVQTTGATSHTNQGSRFMKALVQIQREGKILRFRERIVRDAPLKLAGISQLYP
jgi:hypothetical protein